jgi:hypothetical protein
MINKTILAVLILMLSNTALSFEKGQEIIVNDMIVCTNSEILKEAMEVHKERGKEAANELLRIAAKAGNCEEVNMAPGVTATGSYVETLVTTERDGHTISLVRIQDGNGRDFYAVIYDD